MDYLSDRRRHKRTTSVIPLQYKNLRQLSEGAISAITRDIGEGGVCFLANEFMPLASRLVVEVFLPAASRPVKAISKIAWIRRASSGEQYEIGNQFLEVAKGDRRSLSDYIARLGTTTLG